MKRATMILTGLMAATAGGCVSSGGNFASDLAVLQKNTDVIVLSDQAGQAQVAVVPQYQGRVMTSTADGPDGLSYGWINHKLIGSGLRAEHINVFGGEDRLWFGPEGGPYSIFFAPGAEQNLDNWYTPESIDWGGWDMSDKSATHASFTKTFKLVNAAGFTFNVQADRTVSLLDHTAAAKDFGLTIPDSVKMVAYQSDNAITNVGDKPWVKKTGLLSIWILGMYNPSPATTIVVPFKTGPVQKLGPYVNDAYFGKISDDRLKIDEKDGVIYFSGDGGSRGKIGVSPQRVKNMLGSFDAANNVLTIVQFSMPDDVAKHDYVNSMWGKQSNPYAGDVANSYNDGPPAPGKAPLGPFYEIESSSPAAALKPKQVIHHIHRTMHLRGTREQLDAISHAAFGVGLDEIQKAL